ncbi:MAG: 30S ribosome-binding factor RbfA [Calditrichaceae bacterium]|nr:30S ribosome-binding factor RbfA [Calditrichaceae bacterium]
MAENRRIIRYADSIKRALSNIIEFKLNDPQKGFITLTRVKVSPDLKIATAYYTVLGDDSQKNRTQAVLKKSIQFLRSELKPYITSRWLPELRFFYDDSMERADRINELLNKIKDDTCSSKDEAAAEE